MQGKMQQCTVFLHQVTNKLFIQGESVQMGKQFWIYKNPDGWLTGKHKTVVITILQQDYIMADGFQDTVLQQNFWNLPESQYVQFLHINVKKVVATG